MSSLESDVRFTYWPTCTECQVSSMESDVRFAYWGWVDRVGQSSAWQGRDWQEIARLGRVGYGKI